MEQTIQYMLVMEVTPLDRRKFKERLFVNVSQTFRMTSDYIMDKEIRVAKRFGVNPADVMTLNVVKLQ